MFINATKIDIAAFLEEVIIVGIEPINDRSTYCPVS